MKRDLQRLQGNNWQNSILKQLKINIFFWFYLAFLLIGFFVNLIFSQQQIFFWVNTRNSHFLDTIMPYITDIGDGLFCVLICILILFVVNIRLGLALISTYALEGIAVQVLKQFIFKDRPRPWAAYVDKYPVHLVPDFTPYSNNSFPSGHTTTIFCMAALFILVFPKMKGIWQLLLFLLALLVAYSRIYLSQHYFVDVYVGSIAGILSSWLIYYYFYKYRYNSKRHFPWLDRTLLNLKK